MPQMSLPQTPSFGLIQELCHDKGEGVFRHIVPSGVATVMIALVMGRLRVFVGDGSEQLVTFTVTDDYG